MSDDGSIVSIAQWHIENDKDGHAAVGIYNKNMLQTCTNKLNALTNSHLIIYRVILSLAVKHGS
jgi:hypothetical protein